MKPLGKGALWAFGLIVVAMLLSLLGANLYLRSPGVRQRLLNGLESRFGVGVSYESISYLPWRGVKLSRVTVDHQSEAASILSQPFLDVESVVAKIELWSLVDRPIQIPEIVVVKPRIRTLPLSGGGIALPWARTQRPMVAGVTSPDGRTSPRASDPKRSQIDQGPAITLRPPDNGAPSTTGPKSRPRPVAPAPKASSEFESKQPSISDRVLLGKLEVIQGEATLVGRQGRRPLLTLQGIASQLDLAVLLSGREIAEGMMVGAFSIALAEAGGALQVVDLSSPIQIGEGGALALYELRGQSDGGAVSGRLLADPRLAGLPFQVKLDASDLSVASISRRVAARAAFSNGALKANFEARGFLAAAETWNGSGKVTAVGAALSRNSLLESFGRYVDLKEFIELAFSEAKASYSIQGPTVKFEDIHWKTENLEFKGLGWVGLDGRVRIAARLFYRPKVRDILQRIERQLPERVVRKTAQLEGREDFYRDFVISGPVKHLRANFVGAEERTLAELLEVIRRSEEASSPEAEEDVSEQEREANEQP